CLNNALAKLLVFTALDFKLLAGENPASFARAFGTKASQKLGREGSRGVNLNFWGKMGEILIYFPLKTPVCRSGRVLRQPLQVRHTQREQEGPSAFPKLSTIVIRASETKNRWRYRHKYGTLFRSFPTMRRKMKRASPSGVEPEFAV